MRVWVVYSEFNRGDVCDGGATLEGVFANEVCAYDYKWEVEDRYRTTCGFVTCPSDTDDWDVDVHVAEAEVE